MTADTQKKSGHHSHHHHHHHHNKKTFHLKSIERITHLPVIESAQQYYDKIKNSNILVRWSLLPAETGVWLAVGTALPVVSFFQRPVNAVDAIVCQGLDVIEANLPVITYPPEVVYNITKDYVTTNVVTPIVKRADSVKQLSISGASICGEMAANQLNNVINVADKYVEKYLPDISDATDSPVEKPQDANPPSITNHMACDQFLKNKNGISKRRDILKSFCRLHVYCDGHGILLTNKLKKLCTVQTEVYICVNPRAASGYLVDNAIKGIQSFTKQDVVVLIAGMDDMVFSQDTNRICQEYLENMRTFTLKTRSTNAIICPIFPQYDLPEDAVINETIMKINIQLRDCFSHVKHITVLDISRFKKQKHFTKSGLFLNSKGKELLSRLIVLAANSYCGKYITEPSNTTGNSDSKAVQTIQHVNQFGRKLQRRLTRRTIAEAKALKQQSTDTIRCLVYLVDLLARDPKAFMEKVKEVWSELSKDEPENQVPPGNLEQLISMLIREMARRVVHLANYSVSKLSVLYQHGLHALELCALNVVWWADYFLKITRLESALVLVTTQITNTHRITVEMIENLVNLIKHLKQKAELQSPEEAVAALPESTQQSPEPKTQGTHSEEQDPQPENDDTESQTQPSSSENSNSSPKNNVSPTSKTPPEKSPHKNGEAAHGTN